MFSNHQKLFLLFFVLTLSAVLFQFNWILIILLEIIGFIVVFIVFIWLIFQSLDIWNYHFNIKKSGTTTNNSHSNNSNKSSDFDNYRKSTYPSSYPVGWYPLCWSNEVKNGEIIQKNALGKQYVIFRGKNCDTIGVLDAYCPHLGANLSVGGKVCDDNTIQCPFHLWRFDNHGECRDIPYLAINSKTKRKKIPKNAHTKSYPSVEYNGMICIFYGNNIPAYHLPVQLQLLTDEYVYRGSLDFGVINMHIQEFAENSADWQHFTPIHGRMMFPFTSVHIPYLHNWLTIAHKPATYIGGHSVKDSRAIIDNKYGPDSPEFLYFINESHLKWRGKSIPNTNGTAVITFCGPAGICIFKFNIPSYHPDANIYLFHTHLPENEMHLRVKFHWYSSRKLPRLLVWYVVGNWISQWQNDIAIWENKILLNKPCIVKGDGPIMKMRRWWKQFYPNTTVKNKIKITTSENKKENQNQNQNDKEIENKIKMDW